MNPRGKKLEPKLGLNMPFSELVERLVQTDPKEVDKSIERSKRPNNDEPAAPSARKRKRPTK
jgi:hypothetical protein